MSTFFVDIELKRAFSAEFINLIPAQRKLVNQLMNSGVIVNYALSMDRSRLWVTIEAKHERAVMDVLSQFPLINFMHPEISELAFFDSIHSGFPHLSLN